MIKKVFNFFEEHSGLSWFVVVVGIVGIFIISSLEFEPGATGTRLLPILYHLLSFFFLGLFVLIALVKGKEKYLSFVIGILFVIGYGVFDEIHQFFVPGRACTFFDVFLDSIGVLFAFLIYLVRVKLKWG